MYFLVSLLKFLFILIQIFRYTNKAHFGFWKLSNLIYDLHATHNSPAVKSSKHESKQFSNEAQPVLLI